MAALVFPCAAAAQDAAPAPSDAAPLATGPVAAGVTFFTGPDFTGQSKTLTLAANQPFQAIPFIGDELNEKIGSLKVDPQLGVILFQRPYFANRDDTCGLNLGTKESPGSWWLGRTADIEPPYAISSNQPYETPETQDKDYSSVIAFRRDLGPPPGFLLLERRSYYNRSCGRTDEQNYFNRIFIPVPNPPKREACVDLSLPSTSYGAGADAPTFVRVTEALALLPEHFDPRFRGADHRFIASVFAGPGCSGPSITLPSSEGGRPARYKLKNFEFDRRAKSVLIRYQRGPLDPYLEAPAVAADVPAPEAAPSPVATPSVAPAPAANSGLRPSQAAAPQAATTTTSPAPASSGSRALQPQAPEPVPASPVPQTAGVGLQPDPPSAPPRPQQALQPVPEPQVVPAAPVVPRNPSTPQEKTFRFPVHQVYRLNFCVKGDEGCGDPAANTWCQNKGFSRAARWSREDNIGALYPTVFIGNGTICDKFLCDGFEEITCTR